MAEQRFSRAWYLDLRSGETKKFALKPGHCAWVDHAVLVDPASAAAGQSVRVRARSGDAQFRLEMSAERPVAPVGSLVMLDDQLWLERDEDDSADAVVRIVGVAVKTQNLEEGGEDRQEAVLEEVVEDEEEDADGSEDGEGEEMLAGAEFGWADQEDSSDDDDSILDDDDFGDDTEDEDDDEESQVSGLMRVADADKENQEGGGDSEILVFYRYTRFSAAWSDGTVEARGRTKVHQLRFIAAAGLGARSLAWAGASLAPLIYPDGLCKPLRELWTSLASEVSLPPGAARVKVFVDVGILRPANCTKASMGRMRAALKDMIAKPWPERFIGMALSLPEPMRCGHDDEEKAAHDNDDTDGEQRPAKRRRVVAAGDNCSAHDNDDTDGEQRPAKRRRVVAAGDNCSICFDQLEGNDLAAWPGCGKPHVFHGRCLELVIECKSDPLCPICRRGLYNEPKF